MLVVRKYILTGKAGPVAKTLKCFHTAYIGDWIAFLIQIKIHTSINFTSTLKANINEQCERKLVMGKTVMRHRLDTDERL